MNLKIFNNKIKKLKKMKRHDTHILSSESEKDDNEDDDSHYYNFSHKSSETSNSNENEVSKISNPKSPIELNMENNTNSNNNTSIISSSEIENIFQGQKKQNLEETEKKKKKKSKTNKNKYFIKLKKVNLNKDKDDGLIEINLTYSPLPNYDTMLENSYLNIKNDNINNYNNNEKFGNKNDKNLKKLNTDKNIRQNTKNKKKENLKEKEILYLFCNDDNEGNKKLKRIINLVNQQKSILLKISDKNCFTIKNIKMMNNSSKQSKRTKSEYLFREKDNQIKRKRMNMKNKFNLNNYKNNNINENNKNNNLNLSSLKPTKLSYYQSASSINNFKDNNIISKEEKDRMLYNLYVKKSDKNNNIYINHIKKHRIKSTDSLVKRRQIERTNKNLNTNNILERDEYFPEYIRFMEIHNREKENRRIIKNIFRQSGNNCQDYARHVGNDTNCPICNAMKMKNENNIKIKGIHSSLSSIGNNSTQNSWQNRRIYSALSRILTRRQVDRNGSKSNNLSNILNMNKSKNTNYKNRNTTNVSKISKISNNNKMKNNFNNINRNQVYPLRKLNINRTGIDPNNFPRSNKIKNFRNNNIKYN